MSHILYIAQYSRASISGQYLEQITSLYLHTTEVSISPYIPYDTMLIPVTCSAIHLAYLISFLKLRFNTAIVRKGQSNDSRSQG